MREGDNHESLHGCCTTFTYQTARRTGKNSGSKFICSWCWLVWFWPKMWITSITTATAVLCKHDDIIRWVWWRWRWRWQWRWRRWWWWKFWRWLWCKRLLNGRFNTGVLAQALGHVSNLQVSGICAASKTAVFMLASDRSLSQSCNWSAKPARRPWQAREQKHAKTTVIQCNNFLSCYVLVCMTTTMTGIMSIMVQYGSYLQHHYPDGNCLNHKIRKLLVPTSCSYK